jgi:hypothetical protein
MRTKVPVLSFILFICFGMAAQSQSHFLNSPEDFYIHTRNHVNNVQTLTGEAFTLLKKHPDKWRSLFHIPEGVKVDKKLKLLLSDFMAVHDDGKLITNQEFLNKQGLEKPLILELNEKKGKTVTANYTASTDPTIVKLNRVDGNVAEEFFQSRNISKDDWRRKFLFAMEKMVDPVERSENAVTPEEMGRASYKESGRPLFKIENDRPSRPVKLSKMYSALKDAGVVSTSSETVLENVPGSGAKRKLSPSEIRVLERQSEFAQILEKRYHEVATHFDVAKDKYQKLVPLLKEAGAYRIALDQFAEFELIAAYEKKHGKISDLTDKNLVKKFNEFFFHSPEGEKVLLSRIPASERSELAKKLNYGAIKTTSQLIEALACEKELSLIP